MGKFSLGDNKRKLAALGVVLFVGLAVITGLKFFVFNDNKSGTTGDEETRARTDYSPQEIVELAPSTDLAYTTLFTNADVAIRLGEFDKAEAYLIEAVNQAKILNDQTTIDNSYGMLIRFYQNQGEHEADLEEIKNTIGEESFSKITAPPPEDEVPFR